MVERQLLGLEDLSHELVERSRNLMERYADHAMDLADATLVALAEASELRTIFTLDGDFRYNRLRGGRHVEVVP